MTDLDLSKRLLLVADWIDGIAEIQRDERNVASIGRTPRRHSRSIQHRGLLVREAAMRLVSHPEPKDK